MNDKKYIRKQMKENFQYFQNHFMNIIPIKLLVHLYNHEDWKQAKVIGITISNSLKWIHIKLFEERGSLENSGCSKMSSKGKDINLSYINTNFRNWNQFFMVYLNPSRNRPKR